MNIKNILRKLSKTVMGGAIIIGVASVLSRILGLFRDRLLASSFGAGETLDTYYTAFKLPDLIFNVLVLGFLSASFIPVFLEYWHKDKGTVRESAWHITNSILNILLISLIVLAVILFIFAPQVVHVIAPGFDIDQRGQTADLTRIMLLSVIFFGISNIVSGVLNSFKRFLAYSMAPIMYNVGIIFGILVLVPTFGTLGLAWGVVLGAFLHLFVQIPALFKTGYYYRPIIDFKHPGVKKIFKMMVPRALSLGVNQVNQLVIIIIASTLVAGSITVFNFANNLQFFAISAFGLSLAVAAFPVFSEALAENNKKKFVEIFSTTLRRILFFIIPISLIMLLLRAQIVRLVLGAGNFDWNDTYLTAQSLGFFAISLFAQSLLPLLARSFFAQHDTKTPLIVSLISMGINIVLAWFLGQWLGVVGLAFAFSIAAIINMSLLLLVLRKKMGDLEDSKIVKSTVKIVIASLVAALVTQGLKYFMAGIVDMQTFVGVLLQTIVAAGAGVLIYILISYIFKFEEVAALRSILLKLKIQVSNGKKK